MSQANGETMAKSLNGFLVTAASPAGGFCHVGIMARKKDLLFLFECHVSS